MRRFIYIIAILCAIFFISSCKNGISSVDKKLGLNRNVQSVLVKTYEAEIEFGEVFKGDVYYKGNYLALFDDKGNLTSITDFDEDGGVDYRIVFEYNADNRIEKQTMYSWDGDVTSIEYLYQGEYVINKKTIDGDDIWIREYKRNGPEIQEYTLTENGELVNKYIYLESSKKRHVYVVYDETGKKIQVVQRDFDKKGNILKETISRGKEDEITSYSYNKAGYIIEQSTSSGKSEVKYNEKNLPIYVKGGYLSYTEVILNPSDDSIYYIEYEYDNKGNWIKQIIYEGEVKKPYTISERVINY